MSATVLEEHGAAGVVGTRMLRREDPALLSGEARFVHDLVVPGALHMAVVRSPYAHARVMSVDVSAALGMPGVVAALTGADLAGEWASPMPCAWPVTADMQSPKHLPLALDEVCYVGDAVAVVLARSGAEAQDAAAAVAVDYEELPAAVDLEEAARDDVLAHLDAPSNRAYTWELVPDPEAVRRSAGQRPREQEAQAGAEAALRPDARAQVGHRDGRVRHIGWAVLQQLQRGPRCGPVHTCRHLHPGLPGQAGGPDRRLPEAAEADQGEQEGSPHGQVIHDTRGTLHG